MTGLMRSGCFVLVLASSLAASVPSARAKESEASAVVQQSILALCDKRIALLGELPSHGEAVAFERKSEIVRALVQNCGYRTLVFESPVYDFLALSRRWGTGTVTQRQLDDAIGGFWTTQELAPWRAWLFEEAEHGRLSLRGMDDQVGNTAVHAMATLPGLVAANVPEDMAASCQASVQRNLDWNYDDTHLLDEAEQKRLVDCTHVAAVSRKSGWNGDQESIDAVSLRSFASYIARGAERKDAPDRDSVMFTNATLDGGDKIIVWTATVHAAKQQGSRATKPVGTWMAERWGGQVGAIGFTALGGLSARAGGTPRQLENAPANSLEARMLVADQYEVFAPADRLRGYGLMESRLLGKFQSADWSQLFDGVIAIREEEAPTVHKADAAR